MNCNNFFIKMFTAHSGLSSKRVCGFFGWVACLFICLWWWKNTVIPVIYTFYEIYHQPKVYEYKSI